MDCCLCVCLSACMLFVVSGFILDQTTDVYIYVSPTGSDANDGLHHTSPFKTLTKATSLISTLQKSDMNIYVELMQGYHDLTSTLSINHNVKSLTFRAYNGQEVHLTGGKRLASHHFTRVTDQSVLNRLPAVARTKVKVIHLPDVGITNYGSLSEYGFYRQRTSALEVFFNGEPLRLTRWPNEGFVNVVGLPEGKDGRRIQYNVSEPSKWQQEDEMWAYGYWYWSWADRLVKIVSINTTAKEIALASNPTFGLRLGTWGEDPTENIMKSYRTQGGYFRVINVLAELDVPGEYYVEKKTGNLYVWFPSSDGTLTASDVIYVSLLNDCIHLKAYTQNVVFQDFTLEACRSNGINAVSARNVTVKNMEIRNTGGYNLKFTGDSRDITVSRCFFHDGDGAVNIAGGDRSTLTPSANVVTDNEMWRFSREGAVGSNAVNMFGVGNIVRYNHMYIGQYDAIRYGVANDNIMEYNHIHHTCMNSTDCGAIMTGRDWSGLGNTIRYNYIHHTLHLVPGADNRGIMLDDQASGHIIEHNVFYDNQVHVNIGGGRHNRVANNIMYNATSHSMQVDSRGIKHTNDGDLERHLHAVPYKSSLWTSRYPFLVGFDSQNKSLPEGNEIKKNVIYNTAHKQAFFGLYPNLNKPSLFNVTNNVWAGSPSEFYSPKLADFRTQCHLKEWADSLGIQQPLPLSSVGPRYSVGPAYSRRAPQSVTLGSSPGPCTTAAPSSTAPVAAYLPDGAAPNTLYNVSKDGCWMSVSSCTAHPQAVGTYRDSYGEQHNNVLNSESACLQRAAKEWVYCGSHVGDQSVSIYGPTGAMTIAGDGCFMAIYGCPKHGGPADGHIVPGKIYRDTYAEQHQNGAHNEEACLSRALAQWRYCGSHPNHPVTSLYRPKGTFRTAGAGCWIHVLKCLRDPQPRTMFYDAWGATNGGTDDSEDACLSRAGYFWAHCGSDPDYPVTAYYRPHAASRTVP